jgi:spore germination protein GerM
MATAIPRESSLLGLVIDKGLARVNLSSQFRGADTGSLTLEVAQIACTLATFPSIKGLQLSVDGRPLSVPIGDGSVTDRPVTCANYARYLRRS